MRNNPKVTYSELFKEGLAINFWLTDSTFLEHYSKYLLIAQANPLLSFLNCVVFFIIYVFFYLLRTTSKYVLVLTELVSYITLSLLHASCPRILLKELSFLILLFSIFGYFLETFFLSYLSVFLSLVFVYKKPSNFSSLRNFLLLCFLLLPILFHLYIFLRADFILKRSFLEAYLNLTSKTSPFLF